MVEGEALAATVESFGQGVVATPGPCAGCDHAPACGFASVEQDGKQWWYCHTSDHSCYEGWNDRE